VHFPRILNGNYSWILGEEAIRKFIVKVIGHSPIDGVEWSRLVLFKQ